MTVRKLPICCVVEICRCCFCVGLLLVMEWSAVVEVVYEDCLSRVGPNTYGCTVLNTSPKKQKWYSGHHKHENTV